MFVEGAEELLQHEGYQDGTCYHSYDNMMDDHFDCGKVCSISAKIIGKVGKEIQTYG